MSRGSVLVRIVGWLCLAPVLVLAAAGAAVAADGDNPPNWCFRLNSQGQPSTCTWDGTRWDRSYDEASAGGTGAGFAIGLLFVLAVIGGVAFVAWKVSAARRMARDSGMSTGDATAMALLTDDGFEATYLASNLRQPAAPAGAVRPVADRLRELSQLRDQGVITTEEHDQRRTAILESL